MNLILLGGSGFIGRGIYDAAVRENWNVCIIDGQRPDWDLGGNKFISRTFDDVDNVSLKEIFNDFKPDAVINLAGISTHFARDKGIDYFKRFADTDPSDFVYLMSENMYPTIECCIFACKYFQEHKKNGAIVNFASDVGVIAPNQNIYVKPDGTNADFNTPLPYAVSKAAIIHLTKCLAAEFGQHGIRVNSISPSGIFKNHEDWFVSNLSSEIPLNRMALREEIVAPLMFLISKGASYLNGHNLVVDGGRTIW